MLIKGEPKLYNHIFYRLIDSLYGCYLSKAKKHSAIDNEHLNKIKKIAEIAYADGPNPIETVKSLNDLLNYCSAPNISQIEYIMINEECYIIFSHHYNCYYLCDAAALPGTTSFFLIIKLLFEKCNDKPVYVFSRESTSYKLFKIYERRNKIEILYDKKYMVHGEATHLLKCVAIK